MNVYFDLILHFLIFLILLYLCSMIHVILFLSHTLFMIFKGQHKNAEFKKILEKAIFTKYLSQDTHHIFMTRPAI